MSSRGQTIVELLLLLAISLLALTIIYSIYSTQLDSSNLSRETLVAKSTVNKIVNSANSLALSGAGSTQKILIEIPSDSNMIGSKILGKTVSITLSNGNSVFGSANVDIVGEFKKSGGVFVVDGYFVKLFFDGQKVIMSYDDYELNTTSIFSSAKQGTTLSKFFTIRNNSSKEATFWISKDFSFGEAVVLNIEANNEFFVLEPNEVKVIDFNLVLSDFSSGNYSGAIKIIGQMNDGVSDYNVNKSVLVSVESILEYEEVMLFPKITSFTSNVDELVSKRFSICNSTNGPISSIEWSRASNPSANMLEWFTWPIIDLEGNEINSIPSGSCVEFDLNFYIPFDAVSGVYDANISANFSDGSTNSAYFFVTVNKSFELNHSFFSTQNDSLNPFFNTSKFVSKNNYNFWTASGELDWNKDADYTFNSIDYNRDLNGLVGYWKFDDKNVSGYVLDSATGEYNGRLTNGANINGVGLWDSNAGFFDGVDDWMYTGDLKDLHNVRDLTLSAWIYPTSNGVVFYEVGRPGFWYDSQIEVVGDSVKYRVWNTSDITISGVKLNSWNFVSLVYNDSASTLTGYLNNSNSTSSVSSRLHPILYGGEPIYTYGIGQGGATNLGSGAYFSGKIDEVKIYNRALSQEEILADYNSFLNAKFVNGNIIDAGKKADWNSFVINSDVNYSFGREICGASDSGCEPDKFNDGLVGLWHLNEKNSSNKIFNSATGEWDGTLVNYADVNGVGLWDSNAGFFGGVNDQVRVSHREELEPSDITMSIWINPTSWSHNSTATSLFSKRSSYQGGFFLFYLNNSSSINWDWCDLGSSQNRWDTEYTPPLNTWTNLVAVRNNTGRYLYVNGNLFSWTNVAGASKGISTGSDLFIGGDFVAGYRFKGLIEEPIIWNRALSSNEVLDLYRKGISRLDLDVYTCSDVSCSNKSSSQYFTNVPNSKIVELGSLLNSRYLGFDVFFRKASGFEDFNAKDYFVGSFIKDFNLIYYK
ncbi:MAG: LamG-like jellyroll fold domain-containing protein [Candidatus Iainarchaeum sp.]|jgi:hypothetical protein